MITRRSIEEAATRLAGWIRRTPVIELEEDAFGVGGHLVLKLEQLQHTGSFKPRGALNRILTAEAAGDGLVAASGGNHGAAVAYAAQRLGRRAEIFVPEYCAPVKLERLRHYGAQVEIAGAVYTETLAAASRRAQETGALLVHPFDQPATIAGQGTVGLEFGEQAPDLDTLLVSVGGGGLIAGIAAWFGGEVRVIGVEPVLAPSMAAALEAGRPVDVEVGGVAADALGAPRVGELPFEIVRQFVDRVVLVEDEDMRRAQAELWSVLRVVAEPGGAAALAALTSGAYRPGPEERVGVLICGGNTGLAGLG